MGIKFQSLRFKYKNLKYVDELRKVRSKRRTVAETKENLSRRRIIDKKEKNARKEKNKQIHEIGEWVF